MTKDDIEAACRDMGIHWNHPREVATLLQFLPVAAGRKTVPQDPNAYRRYETSQ